MTHNNPQQPEINEAVAFIQAKGGQKPCLGIILGTGMGSLADDVENRIEIEYSDIPHFPVSTVESHKGKLILGDFHSKPVVMMQGRFHYYEGYSMQQIALAVRVMRALGATALLVMNAVGSVNPLIPAGSLVLVQDHINLMGDNPLIGPNNDEIGPRFPDMSEPYNRAMIELAEQTALDLKIPNVCRGVLVAVTGPSFETAAEYRMFQRIGADIVTMSTIPEVITAAHCGLKTLCISVVTDECLPDALEPVSLERIIKTVNDTEPRLVSLVRGFVRNYQPAG